MSDPSSTDLPRLGQAAADALARGDPAAARSLYERFMAAAPHDSSAAFGLAVACQRLGDTPAQQSALDRALAASPGHLPALLMKADHFAKAGDGRAAQTFYQAVVTRSPPLDKLPPALREEVRRAERQCAAYRRAFEAQLMGALSNAGFDPHGSSRRMAQALDLLLGRKQIYLQSPTAFYFPELPQRQFYEREQFPWLARFEARTDEIRAELLQVLPDETAFRPYVESDAGRPPREYGDLLDNRNWSAFYLIRGGAIDADAAARCPRTMAALSEVPLSEAPGRTPAVLFSLLRPGTRIPPHTGEVNTRLICHLPLIVPGGCGLRVGNESRQWVEGQTLIFDDTIEHEAWNTSGALRVVLLFEVWRPELSAEERRLVSALLSAVSAYDAASSAPL